MLANGACHDQGFDDDNLVVDNGVFIAKSFRAMCRQTALARVMVLFADHYRRALEDECEMNGDDYAIVPVQEIPGWTLRRSSPRSLAHNVCDSNKILAIICPSLQNTVKLKDGKLDVLETCDDASSLFFLAAGCANLECIVAARRIKCPNPQK